MIRPLQQAKTDRRVAEDQAMRTAAKTDMTGRITDAGDALVYVLAGNAYFTLRSVTTGVRYTFRVSMAEPTEQNNWKKLWFVALLAGPENTEDYVYMGVVRDNVFRLTAKSKYNENTTPVKAFRWFFEKLVQGTISEQVEFWHSGRCGRCGRALTVPESVAAGLGPECRGKMGL
jgi:hypothetical protein